MVGLAMVNDIEQGGLFVSLIQSETPVRMPKEALLSPGFNYRRLEEGDLCGCDPFVFSRLDIRPCYFFDKLGPPVDGHDIERERLYLFVVEGQRVLETVEDARRAFLGIHSPGKRVLDPGGDGRHPVDDVTRGPCSNLLSPRLVAPIIVFIFEGSISLFSRRSRRATHPILSFSGATTRVRTPIRSSIVLPLTGIPPLKNNPRFS